jgi:bifunctional polynucleotide phosphatase/kinase
MVTDLSDFVPWNPHVAPKLRALHECGYKIVIFSNQGGVKGATDGKRADVVRARLDAFAKEMGIPLQAMCATQKGEKDPRNYRKPKSGMWAHFDSQLNGSTSPDLRTCFYVGDAAGREGDHSDSDKGFAVAVGIKFFTPDDFFVEGDLPDFVLNAADKSKESPKKETKGSEGVIVIDDDSD